MAEAIDNFEDLIEPFQRRGVDLGLERLRQALADLGHPERRFAAVQVAGTNGKGSICTLVHEALLVAGIRSGLYTSPHLRSWTERIRIGAAPIPAAALRQQLERALPVARRHDLTPFELVTAAAFLAFAEAELELVVLEVGLGGRLDATTCHPGREVVGFASIGRDHAEVLGSDLTAIATEKAGVLQAGAVAVSASQAPEVEAVLSAAAKRCGARLEWRQPLDLQAWPLGLPGAMQAANGAVALGMLEALRQRGWPLEESAIRRGFANARWPGRLQQVQWHGLPLLIDGAHNLPAAVALRREIDQAPEQHGLAAGPQRWVLGMLAHKDGADILRALLHPQDQAWIVPVAGHASWSREQLAEACPELAGQLRGADGLAAALATAALDWPARLLVAGSLYQLGELLA